MTRVRQSVSKQAMIPKWRFQAKSACGKTKKLTAFRALNNKLELFSTEVSYRKVGQWQCEHDTNQYTDAYYKRQRISGIGMVIS